jgi:hypothetical protein
MYVSFIFHSITILRIYQTKKPPKTYDGGILYFQMMKTKFYGPFLIKKNYFLMINLSIREVPVVAGGHPNHDLFHRTFRHAGSVRSGKLRVLRKIDRSNPQGKVIVTLAISTNNI